MRWGESPEGALKDRVVDAREEGAHRSNRRTESCPIGFEPTECVSLDKSSLGDWWGGSLTRVCLRGSEKGTSEEVSSKLIQGVLI